MVDSSGGGRDATVVTEPLGERLYQVVTRDEDTGDVVLKVVNPRAQALRTQVDLGRRPLNDTGVVTTLRAGLGDVNSFEQPLKVAPEQRRISGLGSRFVYDFPATSVTFIRLSRPRG